MSSNSKSNNNSSNSSSRSNSNIISIPAKPTNVTLDINKTCLLIIDMQRDFLYKGGFGEALGNDVMKLQKAIEPCKNVLDTCRKLKTVLLPKQQQQEEEQQEQSMLILHTREGHRPEVSYNPKIGCGGVDIWSRKQRHANNFIGKVGNFGRILTRGSVGHDIITELYPFDNEVVIDKPGKGAFYSTDLELILRSNNIETILVCGVTTEVCVHTTVREANDRGYHCLVIEDACSSYIDEFHDAAIKMIWAQGGIFGSVTTSKELVQALMGTQDEEEEVKNDSTITTTQETKKPRFE